jgi:hypothetical protein
MLRRLGVLAWIPVLGLVGCVASSGEEVQPSASAHHGTVARSARAAASRLFAPDSVWNAPLRPDAPLAPASPQLAKALAHEAASEQQAGDGPWIQALSYSTPIYRVPAGQPQVQVRLDNTQPWAQTLAAAFHAVPIPPDARPAAGTDGHLTIVQPSSDRLWEFWRARKLADGWHAAWGGAIDHVSQSPGYYTKDSWPGARTYWGATATSLPVVAGTMTIAELERGRIDHALAINLPSARANAYAWPAQRTDGVSFDPDAIPEGAHLRVDPRLDVSSLYLPPVTKAIVLAAQRYGMIVRDQTHHAIGFYGEDPSPTGANPYPALFGYQSPSALLADFPWQHVEVLRMHVRHGTGRPQ